MSIKVMTWVWENSPYKGAGLLIHLALADFSDDDGICWPSQARVARKARSTPENVRLTTRRLESDGLLETLEVSNGRGSNKYRLNTPPKDLGDLQPGGSAPKDAGGVSPTLQGETPQGSFLRTVNEPSGEPSEEPSPLFDLAAIVPFAGRQISEHLFQQFWAAYPRHAGIAKAREAWDKKVMEPKAVDVAEVIDAAVRFRLDPNRLDEFTPHPATWLNQHRWLDDPLPARQGVVKPPSGTSLYMEVSSDDWTRTALGGGS